MVYEGLAFKDMENSDPYLMRSNMRQLRMETGGCQTLYPASEQNPFDSKNVDHSMKQ